MLNARQIISVGSRSATLLPTFRAHLALTLLATFLVLGIARSAFPQGTDGRTEGGHPKRNLIVITDLEPDDRIALQLLAANFSKDEIALIGTTVMNSARKKELVRRLTNQVGLQGVGVYQGTGGTFSSYPNIASSR